MASCGACGGENRAEARFCHDCGAVLAPPAPAPAPGPAKAKAAAALASLGSAPRPLSVAPDPPPPTPRSPAPPPPDDRPNWAVPVIVVAAVVVVVGAIVVVMLGSGGAGDEVTAGGDGTATTAVTTPPVADGGSGTGSDTGSDSGSDTGVTATTAPVGEVTRSATLFSNFARLRSAPDIGASVVTTLDAEGASMEVIGSNVDGWYRVRIGADEGYLFGAFVRPPDPGLRIAQTSGGDAVLLNSSGAPLGIDNESGPKVLVVDTAGSLWEVVLADGRSAFVDPATVGLVG